MSKLIRSAVLVGALSLMAASSASATTGPAMLHTDGVVGTASNTAAISGNAASFPAHTFTVGGALVSCPDVSFTITGHTTNTVTFGPNYGECQLVVSGTPVAAATVDTPCHWDLSFHNAIYNDATQAGTGGTVITTCGTTITVESVGCTIHVPATTKEGISTQNITQAGANNTSATAWGTKITASVSALTYTTTGSCPGLAEHGTGNYAGIVALKGLTGSL